MTSDRNVSSSTMGLALARRCPYFSGPVVVAFAYVTNDEWNLAEDAQASPPFIPWNCEV